MTGVGSGTGSGGGAGSGTGSGSGSLDIYSEPMTPCVGRSVICRKGYVGSRGHHNPPGLHYGHGKTAFMCARYVNSLFHSSTGYHHDPSSPPPSYTAAPQYLHPPMQKTHLLHNLYPTPATSCRVWKPCLLPLALPLGTACSSLHL